MSTAAVRISSTGLTTSNGLGLGELSPSPAGIYTLGATYRAPSSMEFAVTELLLQPVTQMSDPAATKASGSVATVMVCEVMAVSASGVAKGTIARARVATAIKAGALIPKGINANRGFTTPLSIQSAVGACGSRRNGITSAGLISDSSASARTRSRSRVAC